MCGHRLRISLTISTFVCLTMCYQYEAKKANLSPSTSANFSDHLSWRWSTWSSWSPCSKTCGRGVSMQSRVCIPARRRLSRPPRFKQPSEPENQQRGRCLGVYKRFVVCYVKQCAREEDMRKTQCSAFDAKSFRGNRYKWEPYAKGVQDCELNCRPAGHQFYVTLSNQVEDGTPCGLDGAKVCVAGQCKTVGCDGVVGSERQFDQCGVCGGDNSTCRIVSGLYTRAVLPVGYNLIARIPSGACNINITELKPSSNYLALRTSNGSYIFNGNWAINWSGDYKAAGTIFYYKRHDSQTSQLGESVSAKGPISEGIDLLLIYQQPNPGIKYEYTLRLQDRNNVSSSGRTINNPKTYFQLPFRDGPQVLPSSHSYQHPLSDSRNHPDTSNSVLPLSKTNKPDLYDRSKHINSHGYASNSEHHSRWKGNNVPDAGYNSLESKHYYRWKLAGLSECSKTCGGGVQHTIISCVKQHTMTVVAEVHCDPSQKPEVQTMRCNTQPCQATWFAGKWEECSVTCGEGVQHRKMFCKQQISPTLNIDVSEELCQNQERLQSVRKCFVKPCVGWQVGEWGPCSADCGKGMRKREVKCLTDNGTAVHPRECNGKKPHSDEMCDMGPCVNTWFFTEWPSSCSSECGKGHVSRKVICLHGNGKADAEEACDQSKRPKSQKVCNNDKLCGGKWFTGPWSQCSVTCGSGNQVRDVLCMNLEANDWRVVADINCESLPKPSSEQSCDSAPCSDEWYITEWTECSKPCNTGVQTREVTCIDDDRQISLRCPESERPSTRRACNIADCPEVLQDSGCKDKFRNCNLVVQARLCSYKYYRNKCCDSCYRYE